MVEKTHLTILKINVKFRIKMKKSIYFIGFLKNGQIYSHENA